MPKTYIEIQNEMNYSTLTFEVLQEFSMKCLYHKIIVALS